MRRDTVAPHATKTDVGQFCAQGHFDDLLSRDALVCVTWNVKDLTDLKSIELICHMKYCIDIICIQELCV